MHRGRYPTFSHIAVGEPDANSEYFSAMRVRKRPIFLECFFSLPHFPLAEFVNGEKYIIYGQKGTGKTSILRYINDVSKKSLSEFLIFKRALLEEIDLHEFSKFPLMLDEDQIKQFKHYHHTIKRLLILVLLNKALRGEQKFNGLEIVEDEKSKSLIKRVANSNVGDAIKLGFDSISSIFSAASVDVEKLSSGKFLLDGGKLLKRNNDDLLNFLINHLKHNNKSIRLFLDEIHFAYRSEESLQQDAILVRDTILATQALNERFSEEQVDVIIYASVRSEYLEHPLISTADISHSIESVGHELTYSNFPMGKSHPLYDLVLSRFKKTIGGDFRKDTFFKVYLSSVDPVTFLERTWSKPRDFVRFFKCAKKLYPERSTLTESETNAVWRNYSQESWKEITSAASPFMSPDAISLFEEILARISPQIIDGSARYKIEDFSLLFKPVYEKAKGKNMNFYDFDHFMRLLYILGIFATRRRDALQQDIFHSYHRGNRNYHSGGDVLVHPTILKAFA